MTTPAGGAVPADTGLRITPAGDAALLIAFGDVIDDAIAARVHAALAALDVAWPVGWLDVMPSFASILVVFDPLRLDHDQVTRDVLQALSRAAAAVAVSPTAPPRVVEIPVLYHPDVAPDLEALAHEKGISVPRLIALHTAPTYHCQMLGFRPGFPFLRGLPGELHAARLATPRASVAAGSVGIGGVQTGVYPSAGPGGWRIIGRTALPLVRRDAIDDARAAISFRDAARAFLIQPGDAVRFVAVSP